MLLKQMGSISIPLPLSPATKLLMDHAKLTVSYSKDWLAYGHQHKLCKVIWGHFLVWEGKWNHSVPDCWRSIWSIPVLAQEAWNLPCAVLLWCPGPRQLSACLCSSPQSTGCGWAAAEWSELFHQPCFLPSFMVFFSTGVVIHMKCNSQSHHPRKLGNRPKCMWIYLNKRNGLWLEMKPGPTDSDLQLLSPKCWAASTLSYMRCQCFGCFRFKGWMGSCWGVQVRDCPAAYLLHSPLQSCWKYSAPLQPLAIKPVAFNLLITLKVVSELLMQQHCLLISVRASLLR